MGLNKCVNSDCNNHVVSNKFELCPACFKAQKAEVKRHKCADPDCSHMIPEQYEFCIPCRKDRESADTAQKLEARKLRCCLISEYKSDVLREGATIVCEEQGGKIIIGFAGQEYTFQDAGTIAARRLAHERKGESQQKKQEAEAAARKLEATRKQEAEAKLRAELLREVQKGSLREGAEIKSRSGSQVVVTFLGKSYTLTDEVHATLEAESKKRYEELERKAAAEAQRKAEEDERARRETERALFVQYKKGELDVVHEERNDARITVLLADERTVSFDDLDELEVRAQKAHEAKAEAKVKVKADRKANKKGQSEGKGENKQGKKGGKEQRKAA